MYFTCYVFSLVLLSINIYATIDGHHSRFVDRGYHEHDGMILMRNLTRRGDYPFNPTTDYFTVGSPTDAGCCTSGQLTTLNSWLSEIVLLHSTVLDAFNEYESDLGIQELFNLWLGITFEDNDVAPASYDLWNANLVRIEAVSNFLAGEGLTDAVTSQPPWLFCNDGYADADEAQWNQPVKDSTGTSVKEGETGYFKLQDVFPKPAANNWAAFWVKLLNAYAFDALNRDGQTLCGQTNRAGFTSKKSTQASIAAAPNTVTTGAYDRYVTICPYGFATTGSHGLPELATAITYTDYPVPNNGKAIDQYTPRSATLYHELFHLTDTAGTTGDPLPSMALCSRAAYERNPLISTNPENFVLFATALYIYKNPPATPTDIDPVPPAKPAVIFWQLGITKLASALIAGRI